MKNAVDTKYNKEIIIITISRDWYTLTGQWIQIDLNYLSWLW